MNWDSVWLASYLLLWGYVLFVGFAVFVILRQLGIKYMATFESSRRDGLPLDRRAPAFSGWDEKSNLLSSEDYRGRLLFLVFASADCRTCKLLAPILNEFGRDHNDLLSILAIGVSEDENGTSLKRSLSLDAPAIERGGAKISDSFKVERTPFAYVIDPKGVIRVKGVVNNRDQLEFMLNEYRMSRLSQHKHAGEKALATDFAAVGNHAGEE